MKCIKRWTTSLISRVDWMVTQVENHEALVNSAIREARQAAARAKVQLGRVRQDGDRLRRRLDEERQAQATWRDRARKCAGSDEAQAMECLRRGKRAELASRQLEKRLEEHQRIESQLAKDVGTLEERLASLVEKRNLMRTRQSRAEALGSIQGATGAVAEDLDEIFDRWETRVTESELAGECGLSHEDSFEEAFLGAEEEQALRAELEELRGPAKENNEQDKGEQP